MDFCTFARLHGVIIGQLIEDGRWHRCPTEDHPRKRNGAYRYMGTYGHIQDHANHTEPILWKPDENEIRQIDHAAIQRRAEAAAAELRRNQEQAAKKAGWILHQCELLPHPYLEAKGFADERGNVWHEEESGIRWLCIPMRVGSSVVGVQRISDQPAHKREDRRTGELVDVPAFEKKFLYGQRIDQTEYVIDAKGVHIFCEGYATGLSIRRALMAMRLRYTLHICFTAGNMLKVAKRYAGGIVVSDFDRPSKLHPEQGGHGVAVAKQIGFPFWQSDREGEDANDFERRRGTFALMNSLKVLMMPRRRA